jgi:hypothetical protein
VRYSNGIYNVAELREGHPQWSNTLSAPSIKIDFLFRARLAMRMLELQKRGGPDLYQARLDEIKKNNTKALVSVDEQLVRYKNERAGINAFIKANGATASQAALIQCNTDLLEIEANINDLQNKKNTADVQETGFRELIRRMNEVTGLGSYHPYYPVGCTV